MNATRRPRGRVQPWATAGVQVKRVSATMRPPAILHVLAQTSDEVKVKDVVAEALQLTMRRLAVVCTCTVALATLTAACGGGGSASS